MSEPNVAEDSRELHDRNCVPNPEFVSRLSAAKEEGRREAIAKLDLWFVDSPEMQAAIPSRKERLRLLACRIRALSSSPPSAKG